MLVYEDESIDNLEIMLWKTLIIDYNRAMAVHDKDSMIRILRMCDKQIENSAYIYGNRHDLARLCRLRSFDIRSASKDIMRQMLITGKNNTVYIPLIGIRINNPFNTNVCNIRPQYRLLDYKYIDDDILIGYVSDSKHNHTDHLKCHRGRDEHVYDDVLTENTPDSRRKHNRHLKCYGDRDDHTDNDISVERRSYTEHDCNDRLKYCRGRNDYVELLNTIDELIIDSKYMDANEYDIKRLCYMRSITLSDDIDKMRADLKSFDENRNKL